MMIKVINNMLISHWRPMQRSLQLDLSKALKIEEDVKSFFLRRRIFKLKIQNDKEDLLYILKRSFYI